MNMKRPLVVITAGFVLGEVHKFFLNIWDWSVVLEIWIEYNSEKRASSQAPFQGLVK